MPPESLSQLRPFFRSPGDAMKASCSGCGTASLLSTTWCNNEKMAVLTPIPNPSDNVTTRLSIGALARLRRAKRTRLIGQPPCRSCLDGSQSIAIAARLTPAAR
jgi:hypothetical protein